MTTILIPVKPLSRVKSRLAAVLPAEARRDLVLAMLTDLLGVLGSIGGRATVRVIGSDDAVRTIAARHGAAFQLELEPKGYNAAVRQGLARAGSGPVAIFPADIPLATQGELAAFLATPEPGRRVVRLAPDARRAGTNGIFLSEPGLVAPCFGEGSFRAHRERAKQADADVEILASPGLALDIDRPDDLLALAGHDIGGATGALLRSDRFSRHLTKLERGAA